MSLSLLVSSPDPGRPKPDPVALSKARSPRGRTTPEKADPRKTPSHSNSGTGRPPQHGSSASQKDLQVANILPCSPGTVIRHFPFSFRLSLYFHLNYCLL